MLNGNRIQTSQPYPDAPHRNSLQVGAEFVDFVMMQLNKLGTHIQVFTSKKFQLEKGESIQGWEIKADFVSARSGRLSIEIAEKTASSNQIWVDSGIYRNDNTVFYLQGNYEFAYIFLKKHLIRAHQTGKYEPHEEFGTVKAFFLPLERADIIGHRIDFKSLEVDP